MTALLDSFLDYIKRGKCEKLIYYQDKSFEFKGISQELPGLKVRFGESTSELRNINSAVETAIALDDFHFYLCKDLANRNLRENLSDEELRKYTKMLLGAQACIQTFRITLEAYKEDPIGQSDNLNKCIAMMKKFVLSVTPERLTEEGKKAISESLSSANLSENDVDRAILF